MSYATSLPTSACATGRRHPSNTLNTNILDYGYSKYVGWGQTAQDRVDYNSLWTPDQLHLIQDKITQLLQGVDAENRPIIVPLETIGSVMSNIYAANSPEVGSIYSRYIQLEGEATRNDIRDIIDRTINVIVSGIRTEILMEQYNKKISVWSTLYGDFNSQKLRQHAPIKIRKKTPMLMAFNMKF